MASETINAAGKSEDGAHTWENVGAAAWTSMAEDAEGNLVGHERSTSITELVRKRRRLRTRHDAAGGRRVVRDMIRYLYLVLDMSSCMAEKDASIGRGLRFQATTSLAVEFVSDYFDQNPISHLGVVICKNGQAEMLTQLSGNPKVHIRSLQHLSQRGVPSGDFSLQNGLEVAGRSLGHMPKYGSREVLLLVGALSTCDPGDILLETLPRLKHAHIRFSCISLTAEIYVCRRISEETDGTMNVCLDRNHLRSLVMAKCTPPPIQNDIASNRKYCNFVEMGFPTRETSDVPTLIHVTKDKKLFARTGYLCPRCKAKASELPTDCAVCGLKLVLSPHLARSFHHLFPIPAFQELPEDDSQVIAPQSSSSSVVAPVTSTLKSSKKVTPQSIEPSILVTSEDDRFSCFGCLKYIGPPDVSELSNKKKTRKKGLAPALVTDDSMSTSLRFQCPECHNIFCTDCDAYLHESLHNCPGCLCKG